VCVCVCVCMCACVYASVRLRNNKQTKITRTLEMMARWDTVTDVVRWPGLANRIAIMPKKHASNVRPVCMYALRFISLCMYACMHVYLFIFECNCLHVNSCVWIGYMYVWIRTYVCMNVCTLCKQCNVVCNACVCMYMLMEVNTM